MPLPPTAEIVCSFTTVKTEPLNPFVWLLLKALKSFESSNRPNFEMLAGKMAFQDAAYLTQAWTDLEHYKLCESGEGETLSEEQSRTQMLMRGSRVDYEHAKLTKRGEEALQDGFIRTEQPRKRTGEVLYFIIRDGSPVMDWRAYYEAKDIGSLDRAEWGNKITENLIAKALANQRESEDDHVGPDEQIYDLEIHWEASRRVKLD